MTTRRCHRRHACAVLVCASVLVALALTSAPGAGADPVPQLAPRDAEQRWIDLRTVPAMAGVSFEVDGQTYATSYDGTVSIPVFGLTELADRLHFVGTMPDPSSRVQLVRLSFPPQQGYRRPVVAVFSLQHAVSFRFSDPAGRPVPTDRVASMTIRSATGEERTLSGAELAAPVMLPATDVTNVDGVLTPRDIRYTVQDVRVDGASTVNRSQQDFYPARTSELDVATLFYDVQVSARDGLFGGAAGDAVVLRRPDGAEVRYPMTDGEVTLERLPRGDYEVMVESSGLKVRQPITVTRDQVAQVKVVTRLDLLVAAAVAVLVVGGLGLVGVTRRRRRARRRDEEAAQARRRSAPGGSDVGAPDPRPAARDPEPVA